ncbi:hypothetical protein BO70DRAFT_394718 [Aspergillus heteromorphus CBS 117.55]|uniref:Uncharacterized protein n=1 Tax=Aspergillus heteromorphus CBS 117.55 TaxID=1448321 RepID=A0A317WRB3_9EURO|nr:uncharacterized protein BO70DRAFT_394718 [Aspergillus heteromorphus CBS 117.55]PWY86700.1 hypothetical protein BO70DRAFT_394718 [Aspergillus heteromorphus CBS 117.55]
MKYQILSILSVLFAATSANPARTTNQQDISSIINTLPQDPNGIIQLGTDGVLRSLDSENQVMAYFPLDGQQISDFNTNFFPASQQASLTQTYQGVDGRSVTDNNQIYNPSQDTLPVMQASASASASAMAMSMSMSMGQNAQATGLAGGRVPVPDTCANVGCTSHNTCYQTGCSSCLRSGNMAVGFCH